MQVGVKKRQVSADNFQPVTGTGGLWGRGRREAQSSQSVRGSGCCGEGADVGKIVASL